MYYEILALAVIIIFVMQYIGGFSINKFIDDNANMFKKLQEDDFEFYAKARYGDAVDIEKLFNQNKTIFPLVRYTERPDVASIHIMNGKIVIVVDTSPSEIAASGFVTISSSMLLPPSSVRGNSGTSTISKKL